MINQNKLLAKIAVFDSGLGSLSIIKEIQKNVWGYTSDLETHTVETHIYRIRKKMIESFSDNNFIKFDKKGYFLN